MHISDLRMDVDYSYQISSKDPQTARNWVFVPHPILYNLKTGSVFGHFRLSVAPQQYGTFKAFFQCSKEFGSIALLVKICIAPPIRCKFVIWRKIR